MIDRDTVMKLASEAGFGSMLPALQGLPQTWVGADADRLQRFATLIEQKAAEAEREACAQLCEAQHEEDRPGDYAYYIRARGTGGEG